MTEPLRLVIFDVDGTLVDSQRDIIKGMRMAFAAVDLTAPADAAILATVGLSLSETMARLAAGQPAATQSALVEAYKDAYRQLRQSAGSRDSSPLYPHTLAVLQTLHAQPETLLGLATGKSRRGLSLLVEAHDLGRYFITQQCADDHPSKPHPSMIQAALAETGVEPQNAVMVGDASFDMQMARAAGVLPIGVSWGYQPAENLSDAAEILDDIRDLPGLLARLWPVGEPHAETPSQTRSMPT